MGDDLRTYKHVDRLYSLSFWTVFASIPVNFYFGLQIAKVPAQAKSFMMRSLLYTTFSTILFASSVFRYQTLTKELSTRYLTNMNNQQLEQYLAMSKGPVY